MGTFYRHPKLFACQHVTGTAAAADNSRSCTQSARVRALCTAQTEFHNGIALCSPNHTRCFCGNQALVVDDIQQCCFHQLCFHDRRFYTHQRFMGKYHSAFGNGVNFACKTKIFQIINEVCGKQSQTFQICNIILCKTQVANIFNRLLQTCRNGIAVAAGIFSVKQIKYYLLFVRTCFKVALHHGQFIQVRQQCQISTFHFNLLCFYGRKDSAGTFINSLIIHNFSKESKLFRAFFVICIQNRNFPLFFCKTTCIYTIFCIQSASIQHTCIFCRKKCKKGFTNF